MSVQESLRALACAPLPPHGFWAPQVLCVPCQSCWWGRMNQAAVCLEKALPCPFQESEGEELPC